MIYLIFEIPCLIFEKYFFFSSIFTLSKQSFLGIFAFGLKHLKITKVIQKTAKKMKLPYYL